MRIEVDADLCQGHAECVAEAPEVFAYEKGDEHVRILQPVPGPAHVDRVRQAVKYCPTMALSLVDDTG